MRNFINKLFSLLLVSFLVIEPLVPVVYAEDNVQELIVKDPGVRLRSEPDSRNSSNILVSSLPTNVKYQILGKANNIYGCATEWYYIKYSSTINGYVCGEFIALVTGPHPGTTFSTTYDRPWTSPKKAIIGGAKFIAEDYISIGQFTSYLMKFNVNPNGKYPVHNHQYMANIRDPMSKSVKTYNSLLLNNRLNVPYKFIVPIFNNMPETTYNTYITNTGLLTADVQDEFFEDSIKDFPDTYKPYLRYLHTKFPLWKFEPLFTNLDFNQSVVKQQSVGSIEISSGHCRDNPPQITEEGWCIASDDAVRFFLDPRNFITEKHIFMFEDLRYNPEHTVEVIQAILNGTFMEGISVLDNQSYASIFVEAGQISNVSALYLASFSLQEVGKHGSVATNGELFEYEGYVYWGLYNFFNIGAYSSASNPVRQGLVWANGGPGGNSHNIGMDGKEQTVNFIDILKLKIVDRYVTGYSHESTISSIKKTVGTGVDIIVKSSNNQVKTDGSLIGTGDIIRVTSGDQTVEYVYIMFGDLSGDGKINSADLLKIRQHLLGQDSLTGGFLTSADVTGDGKINSADLLKIRQHLLGQVQISF